MLAVSPRLVLSEPAHVAASEARDEQRFGLTLQGAFFPQTSRERWPLSSRQHALSVEARSFIRERYRELGIESLPEVTGPFRLDDAPERHEDTHRLLLESDGRGSAVGRWFGVRGPVRGRYWNEDFTAAVLVHEITHAVGAVRWGARFAPSGYLPSLVGLGMTSRNGRERFPLFVSLEEYVACSNELMFFQTRGYREVYSTENVCFRMSASSRAAETFLRAVLEIYQPEQYEAWRVEADARGWRAVIEDYGVDRVFLQIAPQRKIKPLGGSGAIHKLDIYGLNSSALNKLCAELFPHLESAQAEREFRDLATKSHVTGRYSQLFSLIRSRLGPSALKVLAFARPDMDSFSEDGRYLPDLSTLLLSIFADARVLPPERRLYVRSLIGNAIDPRSGRGMP